MQFLMLPVNGTKTLSQVWRKLWPAVMIAEGASEEEEEDLVGFNVDNKDSSWSDFNIVKLDPSNPECVVSQVGVVEWIKAGKVS
jgi:hypothetical protein